MIRHLIALIALCLLAFGAHAQGLSPQQITTVRAAIFATPAAAAQLAAGNVAGVQAWANGSTATKGWLTAAPIEAMDEAPSYTAYDSMVQGKRDSWVRFLAYPRNCARNRVRNWVVDVWGNATASSNAEAVLLACTEAATAAQAAIGGTNRTTGTVSALDRTYTGLVTELEARQLVFRDNGTIWTP